MNIHVNGVHTRGEIRSATITLRGTDADFVGLIDEGDGLGGMLGILTAKLAAETGLVDVATNPQADAARLLRRAAELLERGAR